MTRHKHEQGRTFTRLGLAVVALVLTGVGILGTAGSAVAEVPTTLTATSVLKAASSGSAADGAVCADAKSKEGSTKFLPVYRWADETGNFHTRYSAVDITNVPNRLVSVAYVGTGFAFGNAMWQITTNLVQIATRACPLESAGGLVDNYAGKIAKTILDSGIITGLVAISIIGIAFRGLRTGGASWKTLWPKVASLGLFAVLMTGALASTGGGADGSNKPYKPGVGSPGYFAITIDRLISSLTSAPVALLTGDNLGIGTSASENPKNSTDNFSNSCPRYVKALKDIYTETYGTSATAKMVASTPKAMSSMWEVSGLRAWQQAQFGVKNWSGSHMYCYELEKAVDVPIVSKVIVRDGWEHKYEDISLNRGSIAQVTERMGIGSPNPDAFVWQRISDNDVLDRQLIALAECRLTGGKLNTGGTFSVRHFGTEDKDHAVTEDTCKSAFGQGEDFDQRAFDWPPRETVSKKAAYLSYIVHGGLLNPGNAAKDIKAATIGNNTIDKYSADDGSRDFLRALHGDGFTTSLIMTIAYVFSSLAILIAFGAISIAILIAKIYALVLIFMIFFVILAMLLPNSSNDKLMKFVKQYAGLSFFIFGFQLILAILVLITKVLIQVGNDAFANDLGNMLWVGFSPVIALVVMHMMFKKIGMPSPLNINSGASWGKVAAAGGVGAVAGGAVGAWLGSRAKSGAKNLAKSGAKGAGNWAAGHLPGHGKGSNSESENRTNKMDPDAAANVKTSEGLDHNQENGMDAEGNPISSMPESSTPAGATATAGEQASDVKKTAGGKIAHAKEAAAARKEQGMGARAKHAVSRKFAKAASNIRHKPIQTLAKYGALAGAISIMGPGVLLAVALHKGAKKGVIAMGTAAGMDTEANRDAFARSAERRDTAMKVWARVEEQQRQLDEVQQLEVELQSRESARQVTVGKAHDEAAKMNDVRIRQQEESAWASSGLGSGHLTNSSTVSNFIKAAAHQQDKNKPNL